ncbi:D-arabinitol dehydrogenase 1 [Eurytemora carolleeae]|uniref:D-arabinitol dehydrogenase 1 n=1 Tax=Eurytemora carolleeae TaxID=1294199 RepID=UPI000C794D52|nr:D-arabinitol dehydrogenase 1 [Eurytemora carolleeae]|eukprot:XP_023330520.1 D-arabinitol dehydrogenase 1-like [Eurytemora affinis]
MQALQFNAKLSPHENLRLIKTAVPQISGPTDVLIKVAFAGLCGTDLHILEGKFKNCSDKFVTIGHEFSGVVEEIGAQVQGLNRGDKVGVDPNRPCQSCKFCRRGQVNHCQNGGTRDAVGIFRDGGMAGFCLVPVDQVHLLPSSLSLEQGVLCEPLSCLLHGWKRLESALGGILPGARVLITGAGIVGNLWVSMFHYHGYRNITLSEPKEGRREIVKGLDTGCTVLTPVELGAQEDGVDDEQDGFNIIVECSGYPPALQEAISMSGRKAVVVIFGCAPTGSPMNLYPEEVFRKELTIVGCLVNPNTYSEALSLAANMGDRYLNFDKLGVKVFKLTEYEKALSSLKAGEISKAVFHLTSSI